MKAYEGMTDAQIAHAVLAFMRLEYGRGRAEAVARAPSPYPIRDGHGLQASAALLDESRGHPLVLAEAIGPTYTSESAGAAVRRVERLSALVAELGWGRRPEPEVWLCVPAAAMTALRAEFPSVRATWKPYHA